MKLHILVVTLQPPEVPSIPNFPCRVFSDHLLQTHRYDLSQLDSSFDITQLHKTFRLFYAEYDVSFYEEWHQVLTTNPNWKQRSNGRFWQRLHRNSKHLVEVSKANIQYTSSALQALSEDTLIGTLAFKGLINPPSLKKFANLTSEFR